MQKADTTVSGRATALMSHWGGEATGTTARGTGSGSGTTPMAHCSGEHTGTTVSKRAVKRGGTLKVELHIRSIIY